MSTRMQRIELKAFLRARRAALAPEAVGLPRGQRRLTPGLRREEVAALADVGLTWYTWLEQGRQINVSAAALARIARALALSPSDEAYLFALAGLTRPEPAPARIQVPAPILGMIERYQGPAFVLDPLFDLLAYNRYADFLFDFEAVRGPFSRNHVWNAFMHPPRRVLYQPHFMRSAANLVAIFRMSHAAHPDDPRFDDLVETLVQTSAEFAGLWEQQETAPLSALELPLYDARLGHFCVHSTRLPIRDGQADGATVFCFVPADPASAACFTRLVERVDEAALPA
ncbi:helix-turn-helix transcriptional regulator [Frateuria edaphi]|jgi:transcriptional regulator with XRE-family HTH domain|uniref:helix-turn-helix transcriptional regulator n=1 Tax=Frateuria edaphi TaxID=2898793 RepID=UPI001E52195F|nr:helix-turn-helix transcriptional regulator [Frateuria edaphi]UGB45666.1 helix-turn-helix transcriptional regulator [Frateuria edaphi]